MGLENTFDFEPQRDITAYELALMMKDYVKVIGQMVHEGIEGSMGARSSWLEKHLELRRHFSAMPTGEAWFED